MASANLSKDPSGQIQFKQLLEEAVTKPGTLMRAYSVFWNYSLGNQILALLQANERGIPLGPIASFNRWKELGRHVKRGEKAITLCMPVTCKRTIKEQGHTAPTLIARLLSSGSYSVVSGSCSRKQMAQSLSRPAFQRGIEHALCAR
jgi:N-terminal domain of anti-restriction factor ArdC